MAISEKRKKSVGNKVRQSRNVQEAVAAETAVSDAEGNFENMAAQDISLRCVTKEAKRAGFEERGEKIGGETDMGKKLGRICGSGKNTGRVEDMPFVERVAVVRGKALEKLTEIIENIETINTSDITALLKVLDVLGEIIDAEGSVKQGQEDFYESVLRLSVVPAGEENEEEKEWENIVLIIDKMFIMSIIKFGIKV